MSGSGDTTIPGPSEAIGRDGAPPAQGAALLPALVLVWNAVEPRRVGEVAILEFGRRPERVLGRANLEAARQDPALLHFVRMRPGASVDCGPLTGREISRSQLVLRTTPAGVTATSVGEAEFFLNGYLSEKEKEFPLVFGDVLHFGSHSSFFFTEVPPELPEDPDVDTSHAFGRADADKMAGESPAKWALRSRIAAVARAGAHAILYGETGTGKELVARALHRQSARKGAFVPYNGANLVDTLAELLLFGNAENCPNVGAKASPGLFGAAHKGSLFLDELGRVPEQTQAKMLRALQKNGEHTPLGEQKPRIAEVTVIAATNEPLERVKPDLLPRFRHRVALPPLAARMQDIPHFVLAIVLALLEEGAETAALVEPFLDRGDGPPRVRMSSDFVLALLRSRYPGNVRDLENLVVRAVMRRGATTLEPPDDMPPWRPPRRAPVTPPSPPKASARANGANPDDTERNPVPDADALLDGFDGRSVLEQALEKYRYNQTKVAKALGMSRDQVKRRMTSLGLRRPDPDANAESDPEPEPEK